MQGEEIAGLSYLFHLMSLVFPKGPTFAISWFLIILVNQCAVLSPLPVGSMIGI